MKMLNVVLVSFSALLLLVNAAAVSGFSISWSEFTDAACTQPDQNHPGKSILSGQCYNANGWCYSITCDSSDASSWWSFKRFAGQDCVGTMTSENSGHGSTACVNVADGKLSFLA